MSYPPAHLQPPPQPQYFQTPSRGHAPSTASIASSIGHVGGRRISDHPDSSFNTTLYKVVLWFGFFIAAFGVFLFLGSYYNGSSMGAMTGTFEVIGKAAVKWAVIAGTDSITFSCIFITVGGTGFIVGIIGRIHECKESRRAAQQLDDSSRASPAFHAQPPVAHPPPFYLNQPPHEPLLAAGAPYQPPQQPYYPPSSPGAYSFPQYYGYPQIPHGQTYSHSPIPQSYQLLENGRSASAVPMQPQLVRVEATPAAAQAAHSARPPQVRADPPSAATLQRPT